MGYRHVEDTVEKPKTVQLSIWRCAHCRALAVTRLGEKPPKKCGKCHA